MQTSLLGYFGEKAISLDNKQCYTEINSKFGGYPDFIDDDYNNEIYCNECSYPMKFILQINTPYSKKKKRMMYLFFCENPQCTQIWKVIRSSIESNNKELEKNLSSQKKLTSSDDWLASAGIEVQETNNLMEIGDMKEKKMVKITAKSKLATQCYLMNCVSEKSFKKFGNDNTNILLEKYLTNQEKNSEFFKIEENLSDSSSDASNIEYLDPLLTDESTYIYDKDKYIRNFIQEISNFPKQIVRYCFGGIPISTESLKNIFIPNCSICGSKKTFEFQILSTIIYEWKVAFGKSDFFLKDNSEWSTVIIYSCSEDCNVKIIEESIIVQYIN